jgi:hypothetical protein
MTARFFTDSKKRSHYILMQELAQSCGPACVAMVEDSYKQACMVDGEGRARQLSQKYPGKWTATGGTADMENLTDVLNAEGVKAYRATWVGTSLYSYLAYYAKEKTPVIVHVRWGPNSGHFIVCPFVDADGTIPFHDPWYGLVETQGASLPAYAPTGASGTLSGWIVVPHD